MNFAKPLFFTLTFLLASGNAAHAQVRPIPDPVYGVTLDNVDDPAGELQALQQVARMPTARIVFDAGQPPEHYAGPIRLLHQDAYILGQLADSAYMKGYTAEQLATWTERYVHALGDLVDVWEIGNEVNGDWLGTNTFAKIQAMYGVVAQKHLPTALTFFYEGEPSEPHNCIVRKHGGNDMFTWIRDKFHLDLAPDRRPPETEKIRLGLDYALISWYPLQCPGEDPDWARVFTRLARIFPNSKVGFGEIGTAKPQQGSRYELDLIRRYYAMGKTTAGLPESYVGGYFWWYFAEEMVPPNQNALLSTLNKAIEAGP